jgi:uncharacterized protein YeaO (DUF488 family)
MDISLKRAYEPPSPDDGYRVLIDRLWPRGVSRGRAQLDAWAKELSPSADLRQWFGHDPQRFDEFRRRYIEELRDKRPRLAALRRRAREGTLTLVYSAHDRDHNDAVVLAEVLRRGLPASKEDDLIGYERWVNEGGHVAPAAVLQRERARLEPAASD